MNAPQAEELAEVERQTGKIIAEAFMVRYHPQWDKVVEVIRGGRIGTVRAVQTAFSYSNSDVANIRNQREAGGGALYDIGCYAINISRLVFDAEPRRVASVCDRDPGTGCDRLTSAVLDFGVGQATFVVGTQHVRYQGVHVFGSKGHIEVEIPFNAPYDRACTIAVDEGAVMTPDSAIQQSSRERAELMAVPPANHYTAQGQAFSEAIRGGKAVRNDMQSAVANMRVVDAVFRAAESGRWESV